MMYKASQFFLLHIFLITSTMCSLPPKPYNDSFMPSKHTPSEKKTISIKNNITPEMLTYTHWTGCYQPDPFSIKIDDKELKQGQEMLCMVENDEIEIVYNYSFAQGLYTGTRTCKVTIPKNTTYTSLAFSWNKQPRLWLEELCKKVTD